MELYTNHRIAEDDAKHQNSISTGASSVCLCDGSLLSQQTADEMNSLLNKPPSKTSTCFGQKCLQ